ncbi:MAG: deoxyhypusine synthase family protein [Thermodesulfovibrionales bacterium]|nr:deoxyhypusine synthase family protein [Thermodesulfovibrionales bacterium]
MKYKPIDLTKLTTYSVKDRKSKVSSEKSALLHKKGGSFSDFIKGLPDFLAAKDLKAVANAIITARQNKRPVILGMGAHSIKVGLSALIIDLMRRGVITAIATNGACIIHDFEMAFIGQTSEDVAMELCCGSFGMAKETGQMLNKAIIDGVKDGNGIGQAIGKFIDSSDFPFKEISIFREAYRLDIPVTVHVAIGADIIHMHPEADGHFIGEGSIRDFRLFASVVSDLEGGVYINLGSAVILPEVFLKALTIARNLGHKVEDFTTVNMDFIQHYRPQENVLRRPTMIKGRCFAITGHHEIMFPLLYAMLIEEI